MHIGKIRFADFWQKNGVLAVYDGKSPSDISRLLVGDPPEIDAWR